MPQRLRPHDREVTGDILLERVDDRIEDPICESELRSFPPGSQAAQQNSILLFHREDPQQDILLCRR